MHHSTAACAAAAHRAVKTRSRCNVHDAVPASDAAALVTPHHETLAPASNASSATLALHRHPMNKGDLPHSLPRVCLPLSFPPPHQRCTPRALHRPLSLSKTHLQARDHQHHALHLFAPRCRHRRLHELSRQGASAGCSTRCHAKPPFDSMNSALLLFLISYAVDSSSCCIYCNALCRCLRLAMAAAVNVGVSAMLPRLNRFDSSSSRNWVRDSHETVSRMHPRATLHCANYHSCHSFSHQSTRS